MKSLTPYTTETEEYIQLFASSLNERDRRRYAAVEAQKLGYGGVSYLAKLLGIDPKTIHSGIGELSKKN